MKTVIALSVLSALTTLALSTAAQAQTPKCSYVLNDEAYWEKADGVLKVNARAFRCKTVIIGSNQVTLCQGNERNVFPYVVAFDGAEGDFFVSNGVGYDAKIVCQGVATVK